MRCVFLTVRILSIVDTIKSKIFAYKLICNYSLIFLNKWLHALKIRSKLKICHLFSNAPNIGRRVCHVTIQSINDTDIYITSNNKFNSYNMSNVINDTNCKIYQSIEALLQKMRLLSIWYNFLIISKKNKNLLRTYIWFFHIGQKQFKGLFLILHTYRKVITGFSSNRYR